MIKTNIYNGIRHRKTFSGEKLFSADGGRDEPVSVSAVPRSSTWTKVFDFDNEGLTEHNYQVYTYDFTVSNNTRDEVSDFSFKLVFGQEVFLMSAWNGALEIHQNVNGEELDRIYYVALLHDCGKIGVPDNILGKPGRLTDEEYRIIKSHTVCGGEILSSFRSLTGVGEGALYHHERYDGRGYPEGRAGGDIPFIARMICVADSFDAMNTNRAYRSKLTKEHIIREIEENRGKQFDPQIADVMLKLLRDGKIKIGE